jgi:hypothetical protein
MRFYLTRSSRRHKIGKAHVLAALANAGTPTVLPNGNLYWLGVDDRGVELEIIAFIAVEDPNLAVIKHVFPTALKETK